MPFSQPRIGSVAQPAHGVEVTVERRNLLDRAVGPFGVDHPLLILAEDYAEKGLARMVLHAVVLTGFVGAAKEAPGRPWGAC
jgi:hypothetical protein